MFRERIDMLEDFKKDMRNADEERNSIKQQRHNIVKQDVCFL